MQKRRGFTKNKKCRKGGNLPRKAGKYPYKDRITENPTLMAVQGPWIPNEKKKANGHAISCGGAQSWSKRYLFEFMSNKWGFRREYGGFRPVKHPNGQKRRGEWACDLVWWSPVTVGGVQIAT